MQYKITEIFKTIPKYNPISGHRWTEYGKSTGFEVSGGLWTTTRHRTKESAIKEIKTRNGIDLLLRKINNEN